MTENASHIYQGSDWATYRSLVAEAFDTLDHMYELSLAHGLDDHSGAGDVDLSVVPDLMSLLEMLRAQMRLAFADMLGEPPSKTLLGPNMAMLESRAALDELNLKINSLWDSDPAQNFNAIAVQIVAIKALIKRMDQ